MCLVKSTIYGVVRVVVHVVVNPRDRGNELSAIHLKNDPWRLLTPCPVGGAGCKGGTPA